MKTRRNKHTLSLTDRILIAVNLVISVVAVTILCMVLTMRQPTTADASSLNQGTNQGNVEVEIPNTTEAYVPEKQPEMVCYDEHAEAEGTQAMEEKEIPVIENLQENVSEWCLSNKNTDSITVWKMTDKAGNLLIALKNSEDKFIVTFKYEGIDPKHYDEWTLCNDIFELTTISDIIDYAFTPYHEVGGWNAINVQAQIFTLINRQFCSAYPNSIRGVITQEWGGQYSCCDCVVNRWMKGGDEYAEKEDLEKCFRQVLLVLAGEATIEVPSDVVFAAQGPQGSGVWMIIDGTYYCYL